MKKIQFQKLGGLIPAVIQDRKTKKILMLGFMNKEALKKTLKTRTTWFWSRSRKQLWNKGEASGNFQMVKKIFLDCDNDSLLVLVEQTGRGACHTGKKSCFYKNISSRK